jgi:hypothetical protein
LQESKEEFRSEAEYNIQELTNCKTQPADIVELYNRVIGLEKAMILQLNKLEMVNQYLKYCKLYQKVR